MKKIQNDFLKREVQRIGLSMAGLILYRKRLIIVKEGDMM